MEAKYNNILIRKIINKCPVCPWTQTCRLPQDQTEMEEYLLEFKTISFRTNSKIAETILEE